MAPENKKILTASFLFALSSSYAWSPNSFKLSFLF
jgi:hypothetical protein